MPPQICPSCDTPMDATYEDGAGDDGDSIEEILTCEDCGYELRHTVGSNVYHDGDSYIVFDDDDENDTD